MTEPWKYDWSWNTDVRSYAMGPKTRTVYLDTLDDDELRQFAKGFGPGNWDEWSRAQIMALMKNRCPGGYYIETEELDSDFHPATRALQAKQEAQAG